MSPLNRWSMRTAAVALMVAAMLSLTSTSFAHDHLVGATPADGSTVEVVPTQVVLTFTEPAVAVGSEAIITGPSGRADDGPPAIVQTTLTQAVRGGSPAGSYTIIWRVTAPDGHPATGTIHFTAQQASAAAATTTQNSASTAARARSTVNESIWRTPPWLVLLLIAAAATVYAVIWLRRRTATSKA